MVHDASGPVRPRAAWRGGGRRRKHGGARSWRHADERFHAHAWSRRRHDGRWRPRRRHDARWRSGWGDDARRGALSGRRDAALPGPRRYAARGAGGAWKRSAAVRASAGRRRCADTAQFLTVVGAVAGADRLRRRSVRRVSGRYRACIRPVSGVYQARARGRRRLVPLPRSRLGARVGRRPSMMAGDASASGRREAPQRRPRRRRRMLRGIMRGAAGWVSAHSGWP